VGSIAINLFIESCLSRTGSEAADYRYWLGITLGVGASIPAATVLTDTEQKVLTELLQPWRWSAIGWKEAGKLSGRFKSPTVAVAIEPLVGAFEDVLHTIIEAQDWVRLELPDQNTHVNEAAPHWPVATLQFARLSAPLSHALGLAHVASIDDPASIPDASIKSITVSVDGEAVTVPTVPPTAGTPPSPGDSFTLTVQLRRSPAVGELNQTRGLIRGLSRLVTSGGTTVHNWMPQLRERVGTAFDPVGRLADLIEMVPATAWGVDVRGVRVTALCNALECQLSALSATPAVLGRVVAAALLQAPDTSIDVAAAAAAKIGPPWSAAFGTKVPGLVAAAAERFRKESAGKPCTDDGALIRQIVDGADFRGATGAALRLALDTLINVPETELRAVRDWLAEPRNLETLFRSYLPGVISRALFDGMARAAGSNQVEDIDPVIKAFGQLFMPELRKVLETGSSGAPIDLGGVIAAAAHLPDNLSGSLVDIPDGVDEAALAGVRMRLDTVFAEPSPDVDLHQLYDGALMAIRRSTGPLAPCGWSPFLPFTRAAIGIWRDGKPGTRTREVAPLIGDWPVPVPVPMDRRPPGDTEIRHAIEGYSESWLFVRQADSDRDEKLSLAYSPPAGNLLPLAYGQSYQLIAGFMAPGGVMPGGWGAPDDPFDASRLGGAYQPEPGTIKDRTLLRTTPPGPPQIGIVRDSTAPSTFSPLTGNHGGENVRPLWKEHVAAWSNKDDRDRFEKAQTFFLAKDRKLELGIAPPALALAKGGGEGQANARVWRYWMQRDLEWQGRAGPVPDPGPIAEVDDPAVTGRPWALEMPNDPKDKPIGKPAGAPGGVRVELFKLGRTSPSSLRQLLFIPFAGAGSRVGLQVNCGAGTEGLTLIANRIVATLSPGERYAIAFRTYVDDGFFSGNGGAISPDQRFDDRVKAASKHEGTTRLFGEKLIAFECVPTESYLPDPDALWRAVSFEQQREKIVCRLVAPKEGVLDYVGKANSWRQEWRWDGGPVEEDAVTDLFTGDDDHSDIVDALFRGRGRSGRYGSSDVGANDAGSVLFDHELGAIHGAGCVRMRFEAVSRYLPLAAELGLDPASLTVAARSGDREWRAVPVKLVRQDALPTPRIRIASPLFGLAGATDELAGGFCIFLDETAYDVHVGPGLAELIEVEVTVETVDLLFDAEGPEDGSSGRTAALAVGMDPIREGGDGVPFVGGDAPDRILRRQDGGAWMGNPKGFWDPEGAGARFQVAAILGETLEPGSAAPMMPVASVLVDPVLTVTGGPQISLRPGTMTRIRARRSALAEACELTVEKGKPDLLASPWSASIWVQLLDNSAYGSAAPQASLDGMNLNVKLGRLPSLLVRSGAGPGPAGRIIGILGKVITDVAGEAAVRTDRVLETAGPAHQDKDGFTITFPTGQVLDPSVRHFVQLAVVHRFWDVIADGSASAAHANLFGDGKDVPEQIAAFGPRIFFGDREPGIAGMG
jgi:hypothetical protein